MNRYQIKAYEVVAYLKEVEAESEEEVKDLIFSGDIDFDFEDVTDVYDFQIKSITEEKYYA